MLRDIGGIGVIKHRARERCGFEKVRMRALRRTRVREHILAARFNVRGHDRVAQSDNADLLDPSFRKASYS